MLMDAITDFKSDGHAVQMVDRFIEVKGKPHLRQTTQGWHLCVRWKDGKTTWERLADLKESNQLRLLSLQWHKGLTMSRHLPGGPCSH